VLSLRDPRAKMSKSAADPASRILLTDAPGAIAKKVRSAVTDGDPHITYDPAARPGTANLLAILAAAEGSTPAALAPRYAGAGHGKLKADVADAVAALLARPREEYARLRGEEAFLRGVEEDGARRARERSRGVLEEVRRRVGLA
jgi:tryptophanyl-tRNA synthetase